MKNRILCFAALLLLCTFGIIGCTDDSKPGVPSPPGESRLERDISYGNNERHKLDLYLPANRNGQTPFLILVHGGAWVSGDKKDLSSIQNTLMQRGIGSVSINYRFVSGSLHYEALMEDVDKAVAFCYNKRVEWGIRPDKYIIGGASAGAHMALLYAYAFDAGGRIGAVVSAAGPADIASVDYLNYTAIIGLLDEVELMVGSTYTLFQPLDARFSAASPLANVKNVPTLMLHGTADLVVPIAHSEHLAAALNNGGIANKVVAFPGAGHDLGLGSPANADLLTAEIEMWCKTYGR